MKRLDTMSTINTEGSARRQATLRNNDRVLSPNNLPKAKLRKGSIVNRGLKLPVIATATPNRSHTIGPLLEASGKKG